MWGGGDGADSEGLAMWCVGQFYYHECGGFGDVVCDEGEWSSVMRRRAAMRQDAITMSAVMQAALS